MNEAQALAQLHAEVIAGMTGNTIATTTEVTILTGTGTFTLLVGVFFFIVVWTGAPIIEWFVEGLLRMVDKIK